MGYSPTALISLFLLMLIGPLQSQADSRAPLPVDQLRLPAGFSIEVLTDAVPGARQMTLGRSAAEHSTVYVGSNGGAGKVYAVEIDQGRATAVHTLASGLKIPMGVAYREGRLYISAVSRIYRLDGIDDRHQNPPKRTLVTDQFPAESHHGGKFIAFGPDGLLYVPVGAPCNICAPGERFAHIMRMKPDGSQGEIIARGVRNSVGFDWSPVDRSLWFTDNGRDGLGDDLPADELNRVEKPGQNFGYPFCHQGDTPDPEFGAAQPCGKFVPPMAALEPHAAALGMRFYTGTQFPDSYRNNIFIAQHGSWDRSSKSGYRVIRVVLDDRGQVVGHEPFIEGWLRRSASGKETVWGRPADVLAMPDGSLLVSDDYAGAIYRVTYTTK